MVDGEAFAAGDLELVGIEAELFENRGVDVGDVVAILDGVEAELVGGAVDDAPLDAAAGHPHRKREGMVVAAVGALCAGSAAELGGKQHDRLVEEPAAGEILEEPADRLIDGQRQI